MRALPALLLTFALLLAGCSGGSRNQSTDEAPGDASDAVPGGRGAADDPRESMPTPVTDKVEFSGVIGAGACAYDGTSVQCANLPSLTPPSTEGSNVLAYDHARTAALTGGELEVAWAPHVGAGLSARVVVYTGCPHDCELVEEIASGSSSLDDAGVASEAGFSFEVPPYDLLEGQTLAVRMAPILVTALASAHTGYDVDLTGTLDFEVAS